MCYFYENCISCPSYCYAPLPIVLFNWGRTGWGSDSEKMGKGATLSREELLALKELLNTIEL